MRWAQQWKACMVMWVSNSVIFANPADLHVASKLHKPKKINRFVMPDILTLYKCEPKKLIT